MLTELLTRIFGINCLKNVYVKYLLYYRAFSNKWFWLSTFMRWKFSNYEQKLISMKLYRPKYILHTDLTEYANNVYEDTGVVTHCDISNHVDDDLDGFVEVAYRIGTRTYIKIYPYDSSFIRLFPVISQNRIPELIWEQMIGISPSYDIATVIAEDGHQIDDPRIADMYSGPDGSDVETLLPGDINPWIAMNPSESILDKIPKDCQVRNIQSIEWWRSDGEIFEK